MNTKKIKKFISNGLILSTIVISSCSKIINPSINDEANSNYNTIKTRLDTTRFTNEYNPNVILAEEVKDKKTNEKISETMNVYSSGNKYIKEKRINYIHDNTCSIEQFNSKGKLVKTKFIDYKENKTANTIFDNNGNIEKIIVDVGNDGKYDFEITSQGIKKYNSYTS